MSLNYSTIKNLAAQNGVRVADLLALAPANDPFYTGRPSEMNAAEWFTELWQRFNYGRGVHLRRIHYQIVSQSPPVKMPNGRGNYENTMNCWNYLNNAAKWARYLGLVSASAFVDRRNPAAVLFRDFEEQRDPTPGFVADYEYDEEGNLLSPNWGEYGVPSVPELAELPDYLPDLPDLYTLGYWGFEQPYLVEVWAEKTTMNDVLIPLCEQYHVNLVTGAGELSITAVLDLLGRVQQADRPARILYVSDFDPAGLGMPISVSRKIEYYERQGRVRHPINLEPVVLTSAQVDAYNLPRVPVKDSDRRKANWQRDYGRGQTELDALEALHPGELHRVIEQAILQYYDPTLEERAEAERQALEEDLEDWQDTIYEDEFKDDILSLRITYSAVLDDYAKTRAKFAELAAPFQEEVDAFTERLAEIRQEGRRLYNNYKQALGAIDYDAEAEHPLPDPDLPEESADLLYISSRNYARQLSYYKRYRHNLSGE